MELIQEQLINLFMTALIAAVGFITTFATKWLKQKGILAKLEAKKNIVGIVIHAIEQVYKEADGEQKFNVAKSQIVKMLNKKKIKVSDEELDMLIEACVKEMKNSVKEVVNK